MSDIVFIPTPNWFISSSLDINPLSGACAITAISSVLITNNLLEKFNFSIKDAHTKRLQGVSFYNRSSSRPSDSETTNNLLATCAEDFDIKVWNSDNGSLISQHKLHQVLSGFFCSSLAFIYTQSEKIITKKN